MIIIKEKCKKNKKKQYVSYEVIWFSYDFLWFSYDFPVIFSPVNPTRKHIVELRARKHIMELRATDAGVGIGLLRELRNIWLERPLNNR